MKIVWAFCISLTVYASIASGEAQIDQLSRPARKILQDVQKTQKQINNQDLKQRQVMANLFSINRRMKNIVREKSSLEQEYLALESANRELAKKIVELTEALSVQKSALRKRLSLLSRVSGQSLARIVFSSSSSSDLERNLKIMGVVAQQDMKTIRSYFQSVELLQSRKEKLANRLAKLKDLRTKIDKQEKLLTAENQQKSKMLTDIRKSRQTQLERLKNLRQRSLSVADPEEADLLNLLIRPSFYESKGKLPKPLSGPVKRGFGVIRDHKHNLSWLHKGHFYLAQEKQQVSAVFEGRVAYSGELPGYGQAVILDHGDHFYSVYAGIKGILVELDQEIKQAETIGQAGRNMFEDQPGVYFEIRHFSEPVDPRSWMKGASL